MFFLIVYSSKGAAWQGSGCLVLKAITNNVNSGRIGKMSTKKLFLNFIFFICFILANSFNFVICAEPSGNCIKSQEICGNDLDEDCSGADAVCKRCNQTVILISGCICGGKKRYSGFCCGDSWQTTPCGGEVYYLDVNGDDANNGSKFKPWNSLSSAVSKVKPGDTILINPGKYVEKEKISIKISGKNDMPIIIRGNGKGAFINLSQCPERNGFEVYFANYIIIENLTVCASKDKNSRGIRLTHSNGSIIRNNTVYGAGHANLFCSLSNNTSFEGNEAYGGKVGVYIADSSDYVIVRNNVLHGNSIIGLHMNGDRHGGGDGTLSYALVENNSIYENDTGINCDGVTKSIFRNNLLYSNRKRGIAFFKGTGAVPSNDNSVIHNTIIMPKGAYYAIGLNYGAYQNKFFNNIIVTEGNVPCFSTTGKAHELKISSDYNLFPKNGTIWEIGDAAYRFGKWEKMIRKNLNAASRFVKGDRNDRHSLQAEIDKVFVNHQNGNFNLKSTSPAIDKGTLKHSYGEDLKGNIRPQNTLPDLGAYEYYTKVDYKINGPQLKSSDVVTQPSTPQKNVAQQIQRLAPTQMKKLENKLGMTFQYMPPGFFEMGIDCSRKTADVSADCHQANLTKGFYMQTTEVTQGQWKKLMADNPSFFKRCGNNCPVEQVSWNDIQEFIKRLNEIENSGKYRLPTEAEWEYACRAGTTSPFYCGKCLDSDAANYCGNFPEEGCKKGTYRKKTTLIGIFPSNQWGLKDIYGNVWEWCQDRFEDKSIQGEKSQKKNSSKRIIKGGGWNSYAHACRCENKSVADTNARFANLGFRVVREP